MRLDVFALSITLYLIVIVGCSDNNNDNIVTIQNGEIFGIITDKETGMPIKGATVQIGAKSALTDNDGKYSIKDIPFSDNINVTITAPEYNEYRGSASLHQELLSLSISMVPSESPSAPILAVLDAISKGIESLDDEKIPDIQSHFSKDYVAGDDEATAFAIFAGVVPPNYDAIPDTIKKINEKYSKLAFTFANPEIKFDGNLVNVQMRFIVDAETNPPNPKKWEIVIDGKMTFVKQDDEWKMAFWALIPPFIKFAENPL